MLRAAVGLCRSKRHTSTLLASELPTLVQSREARFLEIFDRSKAKERQKKLKEEASRGYWDDFKELKDSKGKLFGASKQLQPIAASALLPDSQVLDSNGTSFGMRSGISWPTATLLCVAFRSGAEEMLSSWSKPFGSSFVKEDCQHIELSLVESVVMSWWPFKQMILKGRSAEADSSLLSPKYLYHFGDAAPFIQALQLSNRLTGYVFLIDGGAKVRWRGCGSGTPEEVACLLEASQKLLRGQE